MIKGFKDFLLRGNVVDLAVAVVIGTAFGLRHQGVHRRLHPADHQRDRRQSTSPALGFYLRDDDSKTSSTSAIVITRSSTSSSSRPSSTSSSSCPVNKLMERRKRGEEPEVAAPTEDILLLQEIRDLLRQRSV